MKETHFKFLTFKNIPSHITLPILDVGEAIKQGYHSTQLYDLLQVFLYFLLLQLFPWLKDNFQKCRLMNILQK